MPTYRIPMYVEIYDDTPEHAESFVTENFGVLHYEEESETVVGFETGKAEEISETE